MAGEQSKLQESSQLTINVHRDLEFNEKLNKLLHEYSDIVSYSSFESVSEAAQPGSWNITIELDGRG